MNGEANGTAALPIRRRKKKKPEPPPQPKPDEPPAPTAETEDGPLILATLEQTKTDFTALTEVLFGYYAEVGVMPLDIPKASHEILAVLQNGLALAVLDGDRIVGAMGVIEEKLWYSSAGFYTNKWFYVVPSHRNRGVDAILKRAAKQIAERDGVPFFLVVENIRRARRRGLSEEIEGFVPMGYKVRTA